MALHPHAFLAAVTAPVRAWSNFDAAIHALVVIACVVTAGVVDGIQGKLDPELTNLLLAAVGFAAGRSGVSGRVRADDYRGDRRSQPAD